MTQRVVDVTAVVLAGGSSRRMGFDKALLPWGERTLLESIVVSLASMFVRVLVVGGSSRDLAVAGSEHVPDQLAGDGAIVGIHAGLSAASGHVFVMACDACYPSLDLIRGLVSQAPDAAWVCPRTARGIEPLFAVYSQACREPLADLVARGLRRIELLAELVPTEFVTEPTLRRYDPQLLSFVNLNTPADLAALGPDGRGCPDVDGAGQPLAWPASACRDGRFVDIEVPVVPEIPLAIRLDGAHVVTLLTDGTHPQELALGYLHNAGLIEDAGQVGSLRHDQAAGELHVETVVANRSEDLSSDRAGSGSTASPAAQASGCLTGSSFPVQLALLRAGRWTVAGELRLPLPLLCRHATQLAARSTTYAATRSVHAAALVDQDAVVCFREDIGRHNALDKLAGWLLMQRRHVGGLAVFLTGRITCEVILKVARAGSPLVFSLARPTLMGVRLAQQHGITVVGSLSTESGLVFTHRHRVECT